MFKHNFCFFLAYAWKNTCDFKLVNTELLPASAKRTRQYSSVTQTDTTEFLVINQSELGSMAYCFILKAKQIMDEPNIMATKLLLHI